MAAKKRNRKLKFDASQEELKALYAKLKGEFSLDDLKAFDVEEKDTVPLATLIAELEAMVRSRGKRKSG